MWRRLTSVLGSDKSDSRNKASNSVQDDTNLADDNWFVITKDDTKAQRREKLKQSFLRNKVIMRVTEQDFILGKTATNDDNDMYQEKLILPRSETTYGTSTVSNCCVICLDSYHSGDLVVWSCHSECQHAFHQECVLHYLVRIQTKVAKTPCCVCRCNFTDLKVEPRERHTRRRGRGGRRTVRTSRNFDALELPSWWKWWWSSSSPS